MDLFSCIVLIVFGLIFLIGRPLFVKFGWMSPLEIKHPFKYGYTNFGLHTFLILLGLGTSIAGIVNLLILLL